MSITPEQAQAMSLAAIEKLFCTTPARKHAFEQASAEIRDMNLDENLQERRDYENKD